MVTVLQYLVIAAAIGAVVFVLVALVFGRGEQLSPLPARTSPAELPESTVSGADVRALRFAVALRGYRMTDVDWSLEKIADELDRMRAEVVRLGGDPDAVRATVPDERAPDDRAPGERALDDRVTVATPGRPLPDGDRSDRPDDPDGGGTTVLPR